MLVWSRAIQSGGVGSEASMDGLRLRDTAEQVGMAENSRMTASRDDRGNKGRQK
jgi:hypothetical protein